MLGPLLALTLIVAAVADSTANIAQSNTLTAAAVTLPNGDYVLTNVQSGQSLAFSRSAVTDFFPQDGSNKVNLEAYDDGHIISGLGKCSSAQWGFDAGKFDHAAVSYACEVGSQDQHATVMHTKKQVWLFVPVDGAHASVPAARAAAPPAGIPVVAQNNMLAAAATSRNSCSHPGWWLAAHPEYVTQTGGHTECQSRLDAATSRLVRRSRQTKRGNSSQVYNIVATDHLIDQVARAMTSSAIPTFGGYTSTQLDPFDPTNPAQQWTVTPAN